MLQTQIRLNNLFYVVGIRFVNEGRIIPTVYEAFSNAKWPPLSLYFIGTYFSVTVLSLQILYSFIFCNFFTLLLKKGFIHNLIIFWIGKSQVSQHYNRTPEVTPSTNFLQTFRLG